MKVFVSRPLPREVIERLEARFEVTQRPSTRPMDDAQMVAALSEHDVILATLGDQFGAAVFSLAEPLRCQMIANFGVGYNHIDVDAAAAYEIVVSNTPGTVTEATADIALTLMLMTARRAGEGERMLRANRWEGWHPTQMLGLHLSGKTLGIIGMGRIGQAIARRAHFGFGMDVVYHNRSPKYAGMPAVQLAGPAEVAARADVVVAAVPGGAQTHHLINAEVFDAMQDHAIFVNISRGDVVDEAALIAALEAGKIAGAGLDVYDFEPAVPRALLKMENVTLLPHLGTAALEVRVAMGMMAADNIEAFADGTPPPNAV